MGEGCSATKERLFQLQCRVSNRAAARGSLRPVEGGYDLLRWRYRHAGHDVWLGEADERISGAPRLRKAWIEIGLLPAFFRLRGGSGRRLPISQHLQTCPREQRFAHTPGLG